MRASNSQIIHDMKFCKDLMDRLVMQAEKMPSFSVAGDGRTVIQQDIIRLRRELNEVRKKLEWNYDLEV